MRIAIIGAGFTGLTAAYRLSRKGHDITVFEKESEPGGLAIGFKFSKWVWPLEKHYHHWFESDSSVLSLAKEINHQVVFSRPITSTLINGKITQLDSPLSLLKFHPLSITDRLRTALGLAFLKYNPFWRPFEYFTAKSYIQKVMGKKSWQLLWEPLFVGKFKEDATLISASWFWSRIYKRSKNLGYPVGGFQSFAQSIEKITKRQGAKFIYNFHVGQVTSNSDDTLNITEKNGDGLKFDKVINTLPTPYFISMTPSLPVKYKKIYSNLKGIGAVNLVLSLKQHFLDKTYWLNINESKFPFLAVVEHTNFIPRSHYNNEHILYIGNYLSPNHKYFNFSSGQLINEFMPYLKQINSKFSKKWINSVWVWKTPYAQPIVTTHYSKFIPPLKTPVPNLFLANMQQVYPWDRGTNYAVELGIKVASLCDIE